MEVSIHKNNRLQYYYIWISILLAFMVLGINAVFMSFVESMEILEFNLLIPWSMLISTYIFFVVSSTGLCIVTSLGHVFGSKRFELIGKRGVFLAIITLVFGMYAIMLHLGHPERSPVYMWFTLIPFSFTPNIRSAIWGMGFFYTFYLFFIIFEYWLLSRADFYKMAKTSTGWIKEFYNWMSFGKRYESEESVKSDIKWAKIAGTGALISGLLAHSTLGAIFGHSESRAYWYGAYYPVYFLLSAAFSGLAWLLFLTITTYKVKMEEMSGELKKLMFEMAKLLALLLSVGLLFMSYKMGVGLLDEVKAKTIMLFFKGPLSAPFWIFEIAIGTLLPIFILLYSVNKKSLNGVLTASTMVIIGLFVMRYDFIVAGQVYPVFKEAPSLFPTIMEIFVVSGVIAAFFLVYTLAVKYLPLKENHH